MGRDCSDAPTGSHLISHSHLMITKNLQSQQTTDKKVNEVTPTLFGLAPDAHSMAKMQVRGMRVCVCSVFFVFWLQVACCQLQTAHPSRHRPLTASPTRRQVPAIQTIIQPIGLAPTKAKNLQAASAMLVDKHGGEVRAPA